MSAAEYGFAYSALDRDPKEPHPPHSRFFLP